MLDAILAVENGEDETAYYDGLQTLIDNGMWSLEGSMGRAMADAINAGACVLGPKPARDYYGNRIPSRYEVEPGTKGSWAYAHARFPERFPDEEEPNDDATA